MGWNEGALPHPPWGASPTARFYFVHSAGRIRATASARRLGHRPTPTMAFALPFAVARPNIFAAQFPSRESAADACACGPISSAGSPEPPIPPTHSTADPGMLLIPAIDLKDGQCVRLETGRDGRRHGVLLRSGRHGAPLAGGGARRLHLVDLNGAFAGKPKNGGDPAITDVVGDEIPVQLGGGIRDLDTIERYLDDGITYVIIGTAAVKNPASCTTPAAPSRPHHRRPDAKDGKVAPTAGPSSPATTWSTWRRSSRTTASSR